MAKIIRQDTYEMKLDNPDELMGEVMANRGEVSDYRLPFDVRVPTREAFVATKWYFDAEDGGELVPIFPRVIATPVQVLASRSGPKL